MVLFLLIKLATLRLVFIRRKLRAQCEKFIVSLFSFMRKRTPTEKLDQVVLEFLISKLEELDCM